MCVAYMYLLHLCIYLFILKIANMQYLCKEKTRLVCMYVARVVKDDFIESREFSSHLFSFSRFLDSRESKKLEKFSITIFLCLGIKIRE